MSDIGFSNLSTEGLLIRFGGRRADSHPMNARDLGEFLIGIEWIASTGLYLAENGTYPAPRSKRIYSVRVEQFGPGTSYVGRLFSDLVGTSWPLFSEAGATGFIQFFWEAVLVKAAGGSRTDQASLLGKALDILREKDHIQREMEQHRHKETITSMRLLDTIINRGQLFDDAAKRTVRSVGPYCELIQVIGPYGEFVIDRRLAEAIRSSLAEVDTAVQTQERSLLLKLHGLNRRQRLAEVEIYSEPGRFIEAYVDDPAFDSLPNNYTLAFSEGRDLRVRAVVELFGRTIRNIRIESAQIENG